MLGALFTDREQREGIMAFIFYNPNPDGDLVGDCSVRAVSKVLGMNWDEAYIALALQGYTIKDMPSSDNVINTFMKGNGYKREIIPDTCPDCYSVREFAEDHPHGRFLLKTSGHVVSVIDGNYYDSWDSGNEVPIYCLREEM